MRISCALRHLSLAAGVGLLVPATPMAQAPGHTGTLVIRPVSSAPAAFQSGVMAAPALAREGLRDNARDWLAAQTGTDPALIRIGALDGRVDPPVCTNGYRFDFPFESRNTIRANCDNPVRQYYLRATVERTRVRLVLARAMVAGEIVSQNDLESREVAGGSGGFDNSSQLVGRSLRRSLNAGEVPQPGDLEEVATVLRTSSDLRAGEPLRAGAFRTEVLPRSRIPAGAITNLEDASKARLRRDVAADRVLVGDDLIDTRPVLVATRNMMRGETIDGSMLKIIEMDRRSLPADFVSSPSGLDQGEVTGMVRAGEPIRASMIRPALMIKKGQTVMLSVARAGIEINVQVEALEDAKLGDQVKLRNPDSGKSLAGVVVGRGAARAL